jgi:hypothetical protein
VSQKIYLKNQSFLIFKLRVANPPISTCSTVKECLPSNASFIVLWGDSSNLYKDGSHSLITNYRHIHSYASSHVTPNSYYLFQILADPLAVVTNEGGRPIIRFLFHPTMHNRELGCLFHFL